MNKTRRRIARQQRKWTKRRQKFLDFCRWVLFANSEKIDLKQMVINWQGLMRKNPLLLRDFRVKDIDLLINNLGVFLQNKENDRVEKCFDYIKSKARVSIRFS